MLGIVYSSNESINLEPLRSQETGGTGHKLLVAPANSTYESYPLTNQSTFTYKATGYGLISNNGSSVSQSIFIPNAEASIHVLPVTSTSWLTTNTNMKYIFTQISYHHKVADTRFYSDTNANTLPFAYTSNQGLNSISYELTCTDTMKAYLPMVLDSSRYSVGQKLTAEINYSFNTYTLPIGITTQTADIRNFTLGISSTYTYETTFETAGGNVANSYASNSTLISSKTYDWQYSDENNTTRLRATTSITYTRATGTATTNTVPGTLRYVNTSASAGTRNTTNSGAWSTIASGYVNGAISYRSTSATRYVTSRILTTPVYTYSSNGHYMSVTGNRYVYGTKTSTSISRQNMSATLTISMSVNRSYSYTNQSGYYTVSNGYYGYSSTKSTTTVTSSGSSSSSANFLVNLRNQSTIRSTFFNFTLTFHHPSAKPS